MASIKDLDNLLQGFVDGGLPGCGMKVTHKGECIYEGYFGYADIENKVPVTKDSLFRQASMSKLPLYTTMMMLYEQGKYLITEPVGKYIPEYAQNKKYIISPTGKPTAVPTEHPMTISDVLSMKCGLPYCYNNKPTRDQTLTSMQKCMEPLWEKGHYSVQEHVRAMAGAVLAYEPGTHWTYGFGSEITAALIEVLTDMPVNDAFKKYIFEPLGMEHTRSRFAGDDREKLVKLYHRGDDNTLTESKIPFDKKFEPGEENTQGWERLFSNVDDYSRLMTMLANGGMFEGRRIMGRKTIDMMRSNGLDEVMLRDFEDPYNMGYGYGYGVRTIIDKAKGNLTGSIGAFGWTGGNGTWCESDPEEGLAIVYMHNQDPNMELYYHHRVRNVAYSLIK